MAVISRLRGGCAAARAVAPSAGGSRVGGLPIGAPTSGPRRGQRCLLPRHPREGRPSASTSSRRLPPRKCPRGPAAGQRAGPLRPAPERGAGALGLVGDLQGTGDPQLARGEPAGAAAVQDAPHAGRPAGQGSVPTSASCHRSAVGWTLPALPSSHRGSCPGSPPPPSSGPARPDRVRGRRGVRGAERDEPVHVSSLSAAASRPVPSPWGTPGVHPSSPFPCPPVGWRNGPRRPSRSAGAGGLRAASEGADVGTVQVESARTAPARRPRGPGSRGSLGGNAGGGVSGSRGAPASPRALSPRPETRGPGGRGAACAWAPAACRATAALRLPGPDPSLSSCSHLQQLRGDREDAV